jgi:hypothetical protein
VLGQIVQAPGHVAQAHRLLAHAADVARLEVKGARVALRRKHRHSRLAREIVLPLVGGSDAHALTTTGLGYTLFPGAIRACQTGWGGQYWSIDQYTIAALIERAQSDAIVCTHFLALGVPMIIPTSQLVGQERWNAAQRSISTVADVTLLIACFRPQPQKVRVNHIIDSQSDRMAYLISQLACGRLAATGAYNQGEGQYGSTSLQCWASHYPE